MTRMEKIKTKAMKHIENQYLHMIFGGTGDEDDWVEDTKKFIRNLARGTRGFFNGFLGYEDCHCN